MNNAAPSRSGEGHTRWQIMNLMLQQGAMTATEIGQELDLAPAGIRRHLDNLVADELAEVVTQRRKATTQGRGRPAKRFQLTELGRAQFGHNYDLLAAQALQTLRETGGDAAVKAFAKKRAQAIVDAVAQDSDDFTLAVEAVVEAFNKNGYAATINEGGHGVQICQHHCPIAGVAAEFPELCAAEHEAIAELLGHHVQPLASIASGHGVCTTHIPITPVQPQRAQPE